MFFSSVLLFNNCTFQVTKHALHIQHPHGCSDLADIDRTLPNRQKLVVLYNGTSDEICEILSDNQYHPEMIETMATKSVMLIPQNVETFYCRNI